MERLAAGPFEPNHIFLILHTFQEVFVIPDRDDNGDGFALARYDFGFGQRSLHGANLSDDGLRVNFNPLGFRSRCKHTLAAGRSNKRTRNLMMAPSNKSSQSLHVRQRNRPHCQQRQTIVWFILAVFPYSRAIVGPGRKA